MRRPRFHLRGAVKLLLEYFTNLAEGWHGFPAGSKFARSRYTVTFALDTHALLDYLASSFVIMEIHERPPDQFLFGVGVFIVAFAAREAVLPGVYERPRERRPEVDVVRAARPLETVR